MHSSVLTVLKWLHFRSHIVVVKCYSNLVMRLSVYSLKDFRRASIDFVPVQLGLNY